MSAPDGPARASDRARPFAVGAHASIDVMVSDGGVCGRALRSFVCGRQPTVEEEALGRCWRAAVDAIAGVLRPGCGAAQLGDAVSGVARPDGDGAVVELLVHGVGIGIEPPFVRFPSSGGSRATGREPQAKEHVLTESAVVFAAPKVVLAGAGELWASETVVVTRDGGRTLGSRWSPWSTS
jgi:hypothetical protein